MTTMNKTLQRLPKKGQIAGVCAGLANYFDLDVTLMRAIFVILAFATGGGVVVLYIILAIIMPAAEENDSSKSAGAKVAADDSTFTEKVQKLGQEMQSNKGIDNLRNYLGIGLLVLGTWLLLEQFFPMWVTFNWNYIWPALLILAGFLIIARRR